MQTRTEAATQEKLASSVALLASQGQAATSIGLAVWAKVQETNPEETKAFSKGGFQGTAIAPMYQIKRATEIFGPYGLGWGVELINESYVDGKPFVVDGSVIGKEVIHKVYVELWYLQQGFRGSIKQFGATMFITRDAFGVITCDEDHAKKSLTDATSKCLSLLGFSADVYTGRYDDVKYVDGLREKYEPGAATVGETAGFANQNASATAHESVATGAGQSDRYQQYKTKLNQIELSGQPVKDVPGVRLTIEQDNLLTQIEIQTLLQSPLLRLPAPVESNEANAKASESDVFL